ncbi:MAG: hypothetical protein GX558_03295, partial [Clostridiales bacterium]|nr:hypothetical protein [Clostridiales bacterium]
DALPLLAHIKRAAALPLTSEPVKLRGDACFALDAAATDLRGLCARSPQARRAGLDFTQPVVII